MTQQDDITPEEFVADKLDVALGDLPEEAMVFLGVADGREGDGSVSPPDGHDSHWETTGELLRPRDQTGIEVEDVQSPETTNLTIEGSEDLVLSIGNNQGAVRIETDRGHEIVLDDEADTLTVADRGGERIELDSETGEVSISADSKIKLDAPEIEVTSDTSTDITSTGSVTVSGTETNLSSTAEMDIQSDAGITMTAAAVLDLNGSIIQLN